MEEATTSDFFDELRGQQLSAVTFVMDYLQLWFDGPCINVTNPLTVESDGISVTSWQLGFRDALCSQIAKIVEAVEYQNGEALIIRFEKGSRLLISLHTQDYDTPEAFCAHGFRNNTWLVG